MHVARVKGGSHMAMYDDQKTYFGGVVKFVRDVDQGMFK
jgi:proline iminopeptidase